MMPKNKKGMYTKGFLKKKKDNYRIVSNIICQLLTYCHIVTVICVLLIVETFTPHLTVICIDFKKIRNCHYVIMVVIRLKMNTPYILQPTKFGLFLNL